MGPLIPLFWTSGDVSSGFQSVRLCTARIRLPTLTVDIFTICKRSLRRLCFYTCLSFCPRGGGVCLSACWDTHTPWADTPLAVHAGIHPPGQTPPGQTPPWQCMLGYIPPLPSVCWDAQCPVHAGIDMATAADGRHPTGMYSCHFCCNMSYLRKTIFQSIVNF